MPEESARHDAEAEAEARAALERGDRKEVLVILMNAYGRALYRYCYKMLRSRAQADDVHQIVFVQAFRDLGGFSGGSTFRTWLYAIANHRCLDALKARHRLEAVITSYDDPPEGADPGPTGEDAVAARALEGALDACLHALAPHVRVAVLLRYQEGFTYEEMGRMCRERPATLQARVARAMPELRRCLEEKGIDL